MCNDQFWWVALHLEGQAAFYMLRRESVPPRREEIDVEKLTRQEMTDEFADLLVDLIAVVQCRAERDEARLRGGGFAPESADDVAAFWSAYQAGLHDLLYRVDPAGRRSSRRFGDVVAVDCAGWGSLAAVDAYAQAGGVDRAQAIRWLVNAALAHPTRESCYCDRNAMCCNGIHVARDTGFEPG